MFLFKSREKLMKHKIDEKIKIKVTSTKNQSKTNNVILQPRHFEKA
jgi:3-deoxy-D-manno-octulosonic-acid transferase